MARPLVLGGGAHPEARLSSIRVGGFKAFAEPAELRCAGLTLLTGANSAGKSTLLQSLLLLKQTCEHPPQDASLRLNRRDGLLNLGSAAVATADRTVFEIAYRSRTTPGGDLAAKRIRVSCAADSDNDPAALRVVEMSAGDGLRAVRPPRADGADGSLRRFADARGLRGDPFDAGDRWLLVRGIAPQAEVRRIDEELAAADREATVKGWVLGETVAGLQAVLEALRVDGPDERRSRDRALRHLRDRDLAAGLREMQAIAAVEASAHAPARVPDAFRALLDEDEKRSYAAAARLLALDDAVEQGFGLAGERAPLGDFKLVGGGSGLSAAFDISHLVDRVLYLGPLRDDPRLDHGDLDPEDPREIGPKGANAIAYLFCHASDLVDPARLPDVLDRGRAEELDPPTLLDALNAWIRFLGVGHDLLVEQGSASLKAMLRSEEAGAAAELTNVGVGFSQVLPVLTLGLAAERGTILVFEQPELHLHPAVQGRLAGFFAALAGSGVQVVAETHSEHLLNRARLHVANGILARDDLGVAFVERGASGARVRGIGIDGSGHLDDWPDGFFDETENALDELLGVGR